MFEIFALGIYSVQWLGIVLGVGAEVVLLVAHLTALHQHKPEWLASMPAVRTAQFIGLLFILASGVAAIGYQFLIGQPQLLWMPAFGFKWVLIVALVVAYLLEKHVVHGHAALEGFTGATWLALFMVHSIAPVAAWPDLAIFYAAWLVVFGVVWGGFVLVMKYTGKEGVKIPSLPALPKISLPKIPKFAPAPVVPIIKAPPPPVPKPIIKPTPVVISAPPPPPPVPKPVPPPPSPPAQKPVPPPAPVVASKPANLPVIEPLELTAPHVAPPPPPPVAYKPDYDHLPGLRIMPQRAEDLHLHNRAPVVQPS